MKTIMERKKTILVSVNDADIKNRIENFFSGENYRLFLASNFADMMNILENYRVDLIISSLEMPGILITDFLPYLRKNFKDIKLIILMEEYSANLDLYLRSFNVSCTLPWPISEETIKSVVSRSLSQERVTMSG